MDKQALKKIHQQVKWELQSSLDFWMKNGMDTENGGVFTCLDRTGKVYSTDKSVWMQGRCAWMFSHLCNVYGKNEQWLAIAKSSIDFMEAHCINRQAGNRMYFTVTGDGKPLRQRRYCFSEGFYIIANAEYYAATGDEACLENARKAYELVWQLNNGLIADPTGLGPKTIAETRTGRGLADPMIYLNISSVMHRCDPENQALYGQRAAQSADAIIRYHHKPELKATLETVGLKGEFLGEVTAGRVVNPGHDMECAWFLLEQAKRADDPQLLEKAVEMYDFAYANGWDDQYGGLLYFIDVLGHPPEAYEHDMKLWWPHNEMLIASLMIYKETGREEYLEHFVRCFHYALKCFSDPEYGEWYGYLRRDGRPTLPAAKGSTFKGPFHLPRMLVMLDKMLEQLLATS